MSRLFRVQTLSRLSTVCGSRLGSRLADMRDVAGHMGVYRPTEDHCASSTDGSCHKDIKMLDILTRTSASALHTRRTAAARNCAPLPPTPPRRCADISYPPFDLLGDDLYPSGGRVACSAVGVPGAVRVVERVTELRLHMCTIFDNNGYQQNF